MTGMLISLAAIIFLVGLYGLAARGLRLGDRPDDARVTAVLRDAWQPDATRPVVAVTVRNPSGTPMLTGMSVRAERPFRPRIVLSLSRLLPLRSRLLPPKSRLLPPKSRLLPLRSRLLPRRPVSMDVSVPHWTARHRFRAAQYDTVGLVSADADVLFSVPVPEEARRYALTVIVGQGGRRLRVHRIALAQAQSRTRAERLTPSAGTRASGGHGA